MCNSVANLGTIFILATVLQNILNMLKTSKIAFSYDQNTRFVFPDLECAKSEAILILGRSGCGKSTLLHLIAGLIELQVGNIELDGEDFGGMPTTKKDQFRGKNIGIVFQKPYFIDSLNLEDNLLLPSALIGLHTDKTRLQNIAERLNIAHLLKMHTHKLSVGEQQRANIARAVINKPKLILADEPTSALDDENCNEVLKLLKEQAEIENAALVIVTHDQRLKSVIERRIVL